MKTTADEHLEIAKTCIADAVKNLSEIVVHQCNGHDEFTSAYQDKIKRAFFALIEVRNEFDT